MEKKKAVEFYKKIGHVWCPALGDHIAFNSIGFRHLIRKNGFPRKQSEQRRRFALLPFAEEILKNPSAVILNAKQNAKHSVDNHGKKQAKNVGAAFWVFSDNRNGESIKIVVRQLDRGQKHFFSIY